MSSLLHVAFLYRSVVGSVIDVLTGSVNITIVIILSPLSGIDSISLGNARLSVVTVSTQTTVAMVTHVSHVTAGDLIIRIVRMS
jgi:hypothetical protein